MNKQLNSIPRVIAVGDIHGCAVAFQALLETMQVKSDDTLVILGDVIDRGPNSRRVLELLLELRELCQLVCLFGNHEQMLLDVVDGTMSLRQWLSFGGEETLDSYCQGGSLKLFDEHHLEFIRTWGDYFESERHFFAHGNYQPELPLSEQPWSDMRWVSLKQFTPPPHVSGKTAVLGHTSNKKGKILNLGHLVCIDTWCHGGEWLTALEVGSGQVWQTTEKGKSRTRDLPEVRRAYRLRGKPGWLS